MKGRNEGSVTRFRLVLMPAFVERDKNVTTAT
jgi:hypothetical protein